MKSALMSYFRAVRWPVVLTDGLVIHEPVESPLAWAWRIRLHDPQSDMYFESCVSYAKLARWPTLAIEHVVGDLLDRALQVVWAMRKFDIPPSWQSAYYRACGEWPEGYAG